MPKSPKSIFHHLLYNRRYSNPLSNSFVSNFILSSLTTHPPQHPQNQWNWNHNSYNSPSSISFASNATHGSTSKLVPRFRRQQSCIIEFNFGKKREATEPVLDSLESMEGKEVKTTLALGNGGSGESAVGDITDTTLL